ncbi:nucleotide-binding universal stress UspA family protein [Microvirga flocculans]|uniref:Nucleotide-binding universal stress UspA family protein n=1 Tax=Microvirga flocculans TaxID=217168 RepID=A0A7W6IF41_9HYPH|nr:universal stress protein [Microvirga flocculans]MBB4039730.1 nucleotide-binding universal stress UspA family protein [Microvirga flocculans]
MKSILVPIEDHGNVESQLETALQIGSLFDSYVEGIAITPDYPVVLPVDIAIGVPSPITPENRIEMARACRERFEAFMSAKQVSRAAAGISGLSSGWRQDGLMEDAYLGAYGRVFDAIVVGRPDGSNGQTRLSTVEAALFETGRPVLIAPPTPARSFGETAVIAWNRSTETARAVLGAMPLLKKARRIVVLELEDWGVPGPSGAELARHLRMHDMPAEAMTVPDPSSRAGETILKEAAALGCDLLVKGAYTQSRLRQMFFGGATSHILGNATVPVLMAH